MRISSHFGGPGVPGTVPSAGHVGRSSARVLARPPGASGAVATTRWVARTGLGALACGVGLASVGAASSVFGDDGSAHLVKVAVRWARPLLKPIAGAHTAAVTHWAVCGAFCVTALVALAAAAAYLPPLATTRAKTRQLGRAARAFSAGALPALAEALEARASGTRVPSLAGALAEMETAARDLGAWSGSRPGEARDLALALSEASRQVARLATAVDNLSDSDRQRLEELVGERTAALSNANRRLVDSGWQRRQMLDRTVRAAEGERSKLAASLHDGPIQRLAALGLVLDRCRLRLQRDDYRGAGELVERARSGVSEEIKGLRQMMSELRPPVLDEGGLEAAIRDHLSAWSEATGIEGNVSSSSDCPPLSPNNETVAYRVIQEALANVAKHASAGHVRVTIAPANEGAELTVRDDGKGFRLVSQPDLLRAGHFGLVIMKERVELAAGRFDVKSAPLAGTEVRIWLPAAVPERAPDLGAEGPSAELATVRRARSVPASLPGAVPAALPVNARTAISAPRAVAAASPGSLP